MKKKIVILGTGSSGLITAALLYKYLDKDKFEIILIGDFNEKTTIGVGEATLTGINKVFNDIQLNPLKHLKSSTIKIGIKFSQWHKNNICGLHPFGLKGLSDYSNLSLLYIFNAFVNKKDRGHFYDFTYNFCNIEKGNIYTNLNKTVLYGYHINTKELHSYITSFLKSKITLIQENILSYKKEKDTIKKICLSNNKIIEDIYLVIDCLGFNSNIEIDNNKFINFKTTGLINDRAIVSHISYNKIGNKRKVPYTSSIAMKNGWLRIIPLRDYISVGYVYSSNYTDSTNVIKEINKVINYDITKEKYKLIKFKSGFYKKGWSGNILKIGLSYGFVEPLESTGLALIYDSIYRFLKIFNNGAYSTSDQQYFNFIQERTMLSLRDFILFHYFLSDKNNKYWIHIRNKTNNMFNNLIQNNKLNINNLVKYEQIKQFDYLGWYSYLLIYIAFRGTKEIKLNILKPFYNKKDIKIFFKKLPYIHNIINYSLFLNKYINGN